MKGVNQIKSNQTAFSDPKLQQEINDLLQSILNPHATPTRIKNEYHPPKNESSSPDLKNFHNTSNNQTINETIAKYSPQRTHDHDNDHDHHRSHNKSGQKPLPIDLRKPSFDEHLHHGMYV